MNSKKRCSLHRFCVVVILKIENEKYTHNIESWQECNAIDKGRRNWLMIYKIQVLDDLKTDHLNHGRKEHSPKEYYLNAILAVTFVGTPGKD